MLFENNKACVNLRENRFEKKKKMQEKLSCNTKH